VVADAVTAAAGAGAAMAEAAGTVVVAATVASEEAINFLKKRPLRRAFFFANSARSRISSLVTAVSQLSCEIQLQLNRKQRSFATYA